MPCLPPGDLFNPEIEPRSLTFQAVSLSAELSREAHINDTIILFAFLLFDLAYYPPRPSMLPQMKKFYSFFMAEKYSIIYIYAYIFFPLEPDILECEVKWALESITMNKASGGDGIPIELFQNLKNDAVKVLHSICQHIWKTQQWPQDWKRSVFIPIPKKGNVKECSNYHTIAFISHASKVMLKILQARLQQYMNRELPDV